MSNRPSKALAERLGLKLKATYPVFFFWYNEVDNLLVNGNVAFSRLDRPAEAAEWFGKAFAAARRDEARQGSMIAGPAGYSWWLKRAAEACAKASLFE